MNRPNLASTLVVLALGTMSCQGALEVEAHDEVLIAPEEADVEVRGQGLSGTQRIYVNFDGPVISDCDDYCSDAPNNRSWAIGAHFGKSRIDFAPYTDSTGKRRILDELERAFGAYDVQVTSRRPASGPYTMLVVSPTWGPNHGVSPLNCGNSNPNDIAFVYKTNETSTSFEARAAAHELGHSFGLSHVTSSNDYMHWASDGDDFTRAYHDANRAAGKCYDGEIQDAPQMLADALGVAGSYDGHFADDDGNTHERSINRIYEEGLTMGCGDHQPPRYCPRDPVTRGQMAAFLHRALSLPAARRDYFDDDNGTWWEDPANRLAEAGITMGCNERRYCGSRSLTRGEMVTFLDRAFDYPTANRDYFDDDEGRFYEQHANDLAKAGITNGCGNGNFCGERILTRDEMASFLARALNL